MATKSLGNKSRHARLRWMGLAALLFFVLAAGWTAMPTGTAASEKAQQEALPVESLRLQSQKGLEIKALYPGTIEASRSADLAFERPGRIIRVLVEEGAQVRQGQVLATLDTADLQVQLKQAQSQLAQAEAVNRELNAGPRQEVIASARAQVREAEEQLQLARTQEARRQDLLRREAISREEMDSFRTQVGALEARVEAARQRLRELEAGTRTEQLDGQRAQVDLARARVDEIRVQIGKSSLTAPFAGRIARRFADEGAYASPGSPVLSVLEAADPEIRAGLPAELALSLKPGDNAQATIAGRPVTVPVLRVLPELDTATRVVTVLFRVPDAARRFALPGMLAQVEMPRRLEQSGFRVPISALTRADRGLWACYAIEKDPKNSAGFQVERREVEILHSDGDFAFVRGFVENGDRIVANGVNRITDGQRVLVVKES